MNHQETDRQLGVRERVKVELARVEEIRDRFEPGTAVWLTNNGMALAYENVLALLEIGNTLPTTGKRSHGND